jgi:YggT family protein
VGPVLQIVRFALYIFLLLLIGRLVLDYVQMFARSWQPRGIALVVAEAVYTATDPPLKALRKVIPPLRLGSVSLDLSFLVLIIAVNVAIALVS